MNGQAIVAKPVKATEAATSFHGFSPAGGASWSNGTLTLAPERTKFGRWYVIRNAAGTALGGAPTLFDAVNAIVSGKVG